MSKLRSLIYCLLLLAGTIPAVAQQPFFKNYTRDDGFPSDMGFSIAQDSRRFIWLCTNNGLCRFDGRHVKTFSSQNSPVDYGVFHLFPDSKQRLWVISVLSAPVYYQNGMFHELDSALRKAAADTRWMLEDSHGTILLLTQHGVIIKWNGGKDFETISNMPLFMSGGQLINDSTLMVAGYVGGNGGMYRITSFSNVVQLPVTGYEHEHNRLYKATPGLVIGSCADGLFQYTEKGYQRIWEYEGAAKIFYCLSAENDSTFWMGSVSGVCVFSYKKNRLQLVKKMLEGKAIYSIIKDSAGNHWISTGEDGLYFLNAVNSASYQPGGAGNHISRALFQGRKGYVINTKAELFSLHDSGLVYQYNLAASKPDLIYLKAGKCSDSDIMVTFRGTVTGRLTDGRFSIIKQPYTLSPFSYYYRNDGKLFIKGTMGDDHCFVHRVEGGKEQLVREVPVSLLSKTAFCVDLDNRSWIGKKDTLYLIGSKDGADQQIKKIWAGNVYITDLQCDLYNQVWVATNGNGVCCYDKKKLVHQYSTDNGLTTKNCTAIYIDKSNDIWVCSESGLNLLHRNARGQYAVKNYTTGNLLPDNCINSVCEQDGQMYICTNKGLIVFKKDDMLAATQLPISSYIAGVAIKGRDTAIKDNYRLAYGSDISISFSTIAYNAEKAPVYYYTLNEAGGEWNKTTAEKIQYDRLEPGTYTFSVYAEGWRGRKAAITFTILPPWWRAWWFVLLKIIGALLLLTGSFYLVVYYKNRQSELKRRMIESDLKSLRAQINPHFIFNALNSIQDFILSHQPRLANYFLTQFSRLIRMIVDNSGKEYISVEDEISFLKLYLELEQLRLGESFTFEINWDKSIDPANLAIPSMILQPIVENSLLHGLPMKQGDKRLTLHFATAGSLLQCTITDNGIGRRQAAAYKKKQSASMGLENITERLQLVYARENINWQPVILGDADETKPNPGTRVSICIPLITMH